MAKRKRRAGVWSYSVGAYGSRVRVFEAPTAIYYDIADPSLPCGRRTGSLGHKDRPRAKAWADAEAEKLRLIRSGVLLPPPAVVPTTAHIFPLYHQHRTAKKVASEQQADIRRGEMWTRWLRGTDLRKLSLRDWETFIDARTSGEIDASGNRVDEIQKRKRVRDGTVWGDCVFLLSVLNWASRWREGDQYLLSENPARGFPLPRQINVRRPVVNHERFAAVRAKAGEVIMRIGQGRNAREVPSYLPELLDIAWGTGRRVSAILALKYVDLRLNDEPFGRIVWPSDTDKMGKEWSAPINQQVRAAINRVRADRQLQGSAYLFPHPADSSRPLSKELATSWLRRAEGLAGLEHLDGGAWHPFRRGWATSRKHLPDADVAAVGGWLDRSSLKLYQQPDREMMLLVVNEPTRAARHG